LATAGVLSEALARAGELGLVDLGDLYRFDGIMASRTEPAPPSLASRVAES
jgi:hypothetical protein